jgi:prolyl-tRNA editing enzyme YbaK/EbsC (Cys-tRNA(Pro) deacylase)
MVAVWPAEVERVAAFLRAAGAEARLEELGGDGATPVEHAETIGCAVGQVVETLVFVCDGLPVVVLVPGDRRADPEKVARRVEATRARPALPDEVTAATGLLPDCVSPFSTLVPARVIVEQTLLAAPIVWVGGGSPRHLVAVAPAELLRLAQGEPMDVVEEPAYHSSPERAES